MPSIEQEITGALERSEFIPYFQPLVELRTGQIEAFEVLARWQHPTRGLVAPDQFIPVIDEHRGLINALTVCLLRKVFAAAPLVPAGIRFAVNVSPSQFHDPSLPSLLNCLAKGASFDLRRLTVELTESALLHDLKLAGDVAANLKALGIKLALDDFGTGYSSLLHLQALPFDELKVDSSFVRTMVHSRQSRKIISAVLGLGQSLGLRTTAEGVEESAQAELLIWQGCDLGQGWLYERPVPAESLADVLSRKLPVIDSAGAGPGEVENANSFHTSAADRAHLQAIYEGAPLGLIFLDRELRYVSLNQRLADLNGIKMKAHLGRKVADVHPEMFKLVEQYLRRALAGEAITNVELRKPARNHETSPTTLLVSYQPARDEAGEVVGVSIAVSDITRIKQKEKELRDAQARAENTLKTLRASEVKLRTVIQSAPVGIVVAEAPMGAVISANPLAVEIFGSALQPGVLWADVLRKGVDETGAPFKPEEMPMMRAILHGKATEQRTLCFRRPGAQPFWVSVCGTPIYSDEGAVLGGMITVQITGKPKRRRLKLVHSVEERSNAVVKIPAANGSAQVASPQAASMPMRPATHAAVRKSVA